MKTTSFDDSTDPMVTLRRISLFLALLLLAVPVLAQYFPQTGPEALRQRALDAKARLNVLSIALEPGYEDLGTLAYFRMGVGARIVSAYVTNGEAGESDVHGEYPNFLAATRRTEAASTLAYLGGEEYFLNMADFGAASDTAVVRSQWNVDTLQTRLDKLLADLRPDVILIARDWAVGGESPKRSVVVQVLLRALRRLEPTKAQVRAGGAEEMFRWNVDRVLLETGSKSGASAPTGRIHPLWKKSYFAIGQEAGNAYVSMRMQRKLWYGTPAAGSAISYEQIYPQPARQLKAVDESLPRPAPASIRGIDREITSVAQTIARGSLSSSSRSSALRRVAAAIDSVDEQLSQPMQLTSQSRKICMQWKLTLENLRVSLLGVFVRYRFDPSILTERQLAYLWIDSVAGIRRGDSTWLYFPLAGPQWYVDESTTKMLPLRTIEPYRLLSASQLEHDLPAASSGLSESTVGKTFTFFIMNKSRTREHNFVFRGSPRLLYSERFSTEVLTPIVRAIRNERLIVRTTNHSRDGVRDSVHVDDSLATSDKKEFRLNRKDQSDVDTLSLQWKVPLAEGSYIVPLSISIKTVANFAARKFDVRVDSSKRIALVTGITGSPTGETLRRLGLHYEEVRDAGSLAQHLQSSQVVIIDRRAMTLVDNLAAQRESLLRFIGSGGHLIVLAQDAAIWNATPLLDSLRLASTDALEEAFEVETLEQNRLFTTPNRLTWQDWESWLFRRAYNIVTGPALKTAVIPLKSKQEENPLIAEWRIGSGTFTYVDLALGYQFLNVHPGAFRLLANMISY